jgi:1-deoxy-D-xylulose-5-phosphate synthase
VTFASGLATEGYIPIVAIYSTFLQRAYDQIIHDAAIQHLHIVLCLDRAGLVGADGPTHHGVLDLAYLRCIQGMVIMAPKDESELRNMLCTAVRYGKGPIAIRYPRGNGIGVPLSETFTPLELGKGEIVRPGKDVAILALGNMVSPSVKAADLLLKDGIDAEVINLRFVKPIDEALIGDVCKRFAYILTVEDHVVEGGCGSAVLEAVARRGQPNVHVRVHGVPGEFVEHGSPQELYAMLKLDAPGIASVVKNFFREQPRKDRIATIA